MQEWRPHSGCILSPIEQEMQIGTKELFAAHSSEADKLEEAQDNAANDAMLSDAVGGEGDPAAMLAQV
jgi:hypothetical protein